jgi:hypothetical protein
VVGQPPVHVAAEAIETKLSSTNSDFGGMIAD